MRVHHLLGHVRVDARQANEALHELAIRFRIVRGPALKAAAKAAAIAHVVVKSGEGPFHPLPGADRHLFGVVFFLLKTVEAAALVGKQAPGEA